MSKTLLIYAHVLQIWCQIKTNIPAPNGIMFAVLFVELEHFFTRCGLTFWSVFILN